MRRTSGGPASWGRHWFCCMWYAVTFATARALSCSQIECLGSLGWCITPYGNANKHRPFSASGDSSGTCFMPLMPAPMQSHAAPCNVEQMAAFTDRHHMGSNGLRAGRLQISRNGVTDITTPRPSELRRESRLGQAPHPAPESASGRFSAAVMTMIVIGRPDAGARCSSPNETGTARSCRSARAATLTASGGHKSRR